MGKSQYMLLILINLIFSWLFNKFLEFLKSEISFVTKIEDLHQENVKLTHENSKWERRIAVELEKRKVAKLKVSELKFIIEQLQIDNEKLEKHIDEWKLIAEKSKSNADKYYTEMNNIFTALD